MYENESPTNDQVSRLGYITGADGQRVTADDDFWADTVRQYEHEGHDPDLIHMARPLLEGTSVQQRAVYRLLARQRRDMVEPRTARRQLTELLRRARVPMGDVPNTTEDALDRSWNSMFGDGKRRGESNWSIPDG